MNPACRRCPAEFDTRELLQHHSESLHGDFQQALTRKEYLEFRRARGDDLTLPKQFPVSNFLSIRQLKAWLRPTKDGRIRAKSEIYSVRVKKGHGGRKRKKTCAKCGEPFQATHGNQTRCSTCRAPPKKLKKVFPKGQSRRHRRRRCAREKCGKLFLPKSKLGRRQKYCNDSCRVADAQDRRQGLAP